MSVKSFYFLSYLLLLQVVLYGEGRVVLSLYDNPDHVGTHVMFIDSSPDLSLVSSGFEDITSSVCVLHSTWILYENRNYNTEASGTVGIVYGSTHCENVAPELDNQVSSVRHVGYNSTWYEDTINFYQSPKFEGAEILIAEDTEVLDDTSESLIVSGTGQWTLYRNEQYQGDSVCVGPSDAENAYPGIYGNYVDTLGWIAKSASKGCSGRKFLPPANTKLENFFLAH